MYAKLGYLKYKQEKKSAMQDQLAVSFASKSRCKLEMISFVEELTEVVVHANSCPKVWPEELYNCCKLTFDE